MKKANLKKCHNPLLTPNMVLNNDKKLLLEQLKKDDLGKRRKKQIRRKVGNT